jgi:hypothetical protein
MCPQEPFIPHYNLFLPPKSHLRDSNHVLIYIIHSVSDMSIPAYNRHHECLWEKQREMERRMEKGMMKDWGITKAITAFNPSAACVCTPLLS